MSQKLWLLFCPCFLGCAASSSYVHSDTTLGRVVVYRNGVAYFERYAKVTDHELNLAVPSDKVDDFLKSLTVVDATTGEPAPIAYPTAPGQAQSEDGLIQMKISLPGDAPHDLKLSYVTEAPAWKSSYRVMLDGSKKVTLYGWAIVDNTSGEDWNQVKLGVGSSSALSFRFDLRSVRTVGRETLQTNDAFALAPPTGTIVEPWMQAAPAHASPILGEFGDEALAMAPPPAPPELSDEPRDKKARPGRAGGGGIGAGMGRGMGRLAKADAEAPAASPLASLVESLRNTGKTVTIEGFAGEEESDATGASLDRANRVRDQLMNAGVSPEQVVAVGRGAQRGRANGGVRIVDGLQAVSVGGGPGAAAELAAPLDPVGVSHFETTTAMDVPRGTSAMVSVLKAETDGEVVYLFEPDSPRGNSTYAFRAIRLRNPTSSMLESGPITVFGEGRFIGEGLAEPIPAGSTAFVPFALDRQVLVERDNSERDEVTRILTVQRGVFSAEVQHTKKTVYHLTNRLAEPTTVYIRVTPAVGYKLTQPADGERFGSAYVLRVDLPAGAKKDFVVEESTPIHRSLDLRSPAGLDMVKVYLSSNAASGPLKAKVDALLKDHQEMADIGERIHTVRQQMGEYRARMNELHAQVVTLRAVKSAGPLLRQLEKKMGEASDLVSKATIDVVGLEEKLMLAKFRFQDGVAELSMDTKG